MHLLRKEHHTYVILAYGTWSLKISRIKKAIGKWSCNSTHAFVDTIVSLQILIISLQQAFFLDISKKTQGGSGKNSSIFSQKLKQICYETQEFANQKPIFS